MTACDHVLRDCDAQTTACLVCGHTFTRRPHRGPMKPLTIIAPIAYVGSVVLANVVTTRYGLVPVGFGLMATAGTYLAGLSLGLRDLTQEAIGRVGVLVLIGVAAVLSYLLADPFIATASLCAFLLAELADMGVYEPLRKHRLLLAVVLSNTVGAVVDTVVFLWVAPFPLTGEAFTAQIVAKVLWATLLPVLLFAAVRRARR